LDDDGDDPASDDSEDDPAVHNSVGDGDHGIVVQTGWIGSLHVGSAGDSAAALADPIIATVEVQPSLTSLYVDDDPPREMARSGDVHVITVEARTTRAVVLLGLRPVVVSRRPPRRACVEVRMGGIITPRPFTTGFDSDHPKLTALQQNFPFSVSATDVEQFHFVPHVSTTEVGWRLELDWLVAGKRGTTVIDDHGKPFGLYPSQALADESDLDWGCGLFHLPGCPAERLEALGRCWTFSTTSTRPGSRNSAPPSPAPSSAPGVRRWAGTTATPSPSRTGSPGTCSSSASSSRPTCCSRAPTGAAYGLSGRMTRGRWSRQRTWPCP
jgi:hypothetical protein